MNLLGMTSPGPWQRHDEAPHLVVDANGKVVCNTSSSACLGDKRPHNEYVFNPSLIELAPDHALLAAGVRRKVVREMWAQDPDYEHRGDVLFSDGRRFETVLDNFGVPALTPDLRAALRRALGIPAAVRTDAAQWR